MKIRTYMDDTIEGNKLLEYSLTQMLEKACQSGSGIDISLNRYYNGTREFSAQHANDSLVKEGLFEISKIPLSKGFEFSDYNGKEFPRGYGFGYDLPGSIYHKPEDTQRLILRENYRGQKGFPAMVVILNQLIQKDFPNTSLEKRASNIIPIGFGDKLDKRFEKLELGVEKIESFSEGSGLIPTIAKNAADAQSYMISELKKTREKLKAISDPEGSGFRKICWDLSREEIVEKYSLPYGEGE